jgi:hypothetical protein
LFLGTESDNIRDMYLKGRHPVPPEKCGHTVLTRAQVAEARNRKATEVISYGKLAKEYGVNKSTMMDAIKGKTWKGAYQLKPIINAKVIDKSKPKNRKCKHCDNWEHIGKCKLTGQPKNFWNCCKSFTWANDYPPKEAENVL